MKHHEVAVGTVQLTFKYNFKMFTLKHLIKLSRNQYSYYCKYRQFGSYSRIEAMRQAGAH